jgi:sulfatase maturation enzyme AslB (radical SAM superfamily)
MPVTFALDVITRCKNIGAQALTFVGGEPTLYKDLQQLVCAAHELGYSQINLDTNGLLCDAILSIPPQKLHYVRVSLDGPNKALHETVRGTDTYDTTIATIQRLIKHGYNVAITSTVFSFTIDVADQFLTLADDLGIRLINFHTFSEEGFGRTKISWSLRPGEWIAFCDNIQRLACTHETSVWYPPTWTTADRLSSFVAQGFHGCLGCSLDRLSVFPDGTCYLCSVLFDQDVNFAVFTRNGLTLNRGRNEYEMFTEAVFSAESPSLSGCPAEASLRSNPESGLISMCRCWKAQA